MQTHTTQQRTRYLVFISVIVGYAAYYLLRKNFSIVMPYLSDDFTQSQLGVILSAVSIAYGIGNLIMGFMVDYINPKKVFMLGLIFSALINVIFGVVPVQHSIVFMFILMFMNGFAQGVGYPASSKLITHFAINQQQQDRVVTFWSIGQNIGGGLMSPIAYIGIALISMVPLLTHDAYKGAFIIPGVLVLLIACLLLYLFHIGQVTVPPSSIDREGAMIRKLLRTFYNNACRLLKSPYFLLILGANIVAYFIRYAALDWSPTLMGQLRHMSENQSATLYMLYEWMGIIGTLVFSFLVHRYFPNRATYIGLGFMIGMLVYGPLLFVNMEAMSVVSFELIGAAVGLLGFVGNIIGAAAANFVVGYFISISWNSSFLFIMSIEVIGILIFSMMTYLKKHTVEKI